MYIDTPWKKLLTLSVSSKGDAILFFTVCTRTTENEFNISLFLPLTLVVVVGGGVISPQPKEDYSETFSLIWFKKPKTPARK